MSRSERESYASNKLRNQELEARRARIRILNDRFRTTLSGGRIVLTLGVQALAPTARMAMLHAIINFGPFTPDNDPNEEHDFGSIDQGGQRFFWKIDYYDKQLEYGSPDPAVEDVTARVMTIMLAEEY